MPGDVLLEAREVRVRYRSSAAARPSGVSLTAAPGEVLLLLGPSGCGKSIFGLTLNGLVPHSVPAAMGGTVAVGGLDTRESSTAELAASVGMVFQDPDAQVVTGTVLDEVCFGLENLLLPAGEVLDRAAEAIAAVGLAGREDDDPDTLSGGGRQRLALACALAMRPRLLVLDEPTANLDPAGSRELYALLRTLTADRSRAVVLIEHDLDDAIDLVDRVAVLDADGALLLQGPPRTVFAEHAAELDELGVWLPTAVLAARRLAAAGAPLSPLPLTPEEFAATAAAAPNLPAPAPGEEQRTAAVPCPPAPTPGGEDHTAAGDPPPPLETAGAEKEGKPGDPNPGTAAPPAKTHLRTARPAAATVSTPAIEIRGLTVRRGDRLALDGVEMDVPEHDFLAVVGGNGAGKTTLAQAVAGVRPGPRGTVRVRGRDVARIPAGELAAQVGYVFQNPEHQFVTGSVHDELAHGPRVRRWPRERVRTEVEALLHRFGLERYRDVNPFLLSHGEKRRLSVAAALAGGPDLLVLDEPTFGQDRARAGELLSLLAELHSDGRTVVAVTHDLQLVAEHARSVAVLSGARLLAHGPVREVLSDEALLEKAGLRPPPLRRLAAPLAARHPSWGAVQRLGDLPGGDR